ncbi:MAG TPA: ATP-binding cassette domain-containing protein [Balneolales bacterium]|nr:ATP-binding cassette domain-containing protein [Balneolales bacterium]
MAISVENLTKVYGPQTAVDNISFEVKTGEILGFLGPNGAGKSTTMKIITCYINPTDGNVSLDGYNISENANEVRRRIGYLPENNPLYLDMSIVDYLRYAAELQKVPSDEIISRIRKMIEICGLGHEMHKNIGELSKGYRQRVGLAQALIHDPDVLILDEPTTGLDPNQIVEIRSLIKDIGREKTVMLSSHILKEVEMTCDRILIINRGKLVANGTTEELSRRASGGDRVLVQIKTDDNSVGDSLMKLSGVASAKPAEDKADGFWYVDSKPDVESREEILNSALKKIGC